ncbi:MAG: hypothetical protein ABI321_15265 [Polyangia bacterium]
MRGAVTRLRSQFDWPLAATIFVLIAMGLVNLWSATRVAPKGLYTQQLAWLAAGVVACFLGERRRSAPFAPRPPGSLRRRRSAFARSSAEVG